MQSRATVEIIADKLYWVSDRDHPKDIKNAFYFCIDDVLVYEPFNLDFGPLNLGKTWKYVSELQKLLSDIKYRTSHLYHYTSLRPEKIANSAYLMCAYQVIVLGKTPEQAFKPFKNINFVDFRDASYGDCSYKCTIMDCIRGLHYAIKIGWFNYKTFDIKSYQHYERVENGDMNWIVPNKFIAFSSPAETAYDSEGMKQYTPLDYIPIFKKFNVKYVVRLNKKTYDAAGFTKNGIKHQQMYFADGTAPTLDIVNKFIELAESTDGVIAVHCKAGLGRTGTLIGCYVMKHYQFCAADFIGWIRICRPGSILGPQQYFLLEQEKQLKEKGLNSPIWKKVSQQIEESCMLKQVKNLSVRDKKSDMDERDREIQRNGDVGQGERLVDAKARRQTRGGSLMVVSGSDHQFDTASYNIYTAMNKFLRQISYIGVRNAISKRLPGFEQYMTGHRMPTFPKIVVYSANEANNELVEKAFSNFEWYAPSQQNPNSDAVIVEEATQAVTNFGGDVAEGHLFKGFPYNTKQALLLDEKLNGVNLAVYLKSDKQPAEFEQSIQDLLDYYDSTGTLLRWDVTEQVTEEAVEKFNRSVLSNIKLN